jgi:hypothetical protein
MLKLPLLALPAASLLLASCSCSGAFADAVVHYQSGTGFGPGLTDPSAALGAPSSQTVDPDPIWGGTYPVDPFNPAYLGSQVVSLGTNGSLTVRFDTPIANDSSHPYGLDFIIYGNTGFIDINWPSGLTDESGSLFGDNGGHTSISVSADGATFYRLNPLLAPTVDGLFPTDGQGAFGSPVNPALTGASLANCTLEQIRSLYAGSAGGTGYDLAWAQDQNGQSVQLNTVSFIRIDVLEGKVEIDALAAVPEPASWVLGGLAIGFMGLLRGRRRSKAACTAPATD